MNATTATQMATKHFGTLNARDDEGTVFRFHFPFLVHAANFYNEVVTLASHVEWNALVRPTVVVVTL